MKNILVALSLLVAGSLVASPRHLLYSNTGGNRTTLVLVNPTGASVPVPAFWAPIPEPQLGSGTSIYGTPVVLSPYQTFRFEDWPKAGGDIATVDVPEEMGAYTEIKDANGSILRVPQLDSFTGSVQLQDLLVGADQRAYLLVFGDATVEWFHDGRSMGAAIADSVSGTVSVYAAPVGVNRAVVSVPLLGGSSGVAANFSVVAWHARQSGRYELQSLVLPTPLP